MLQDLITLEGEGFKVGDWEGFEVGDWVGAGFDGGASLGGNWEGVILGASAGGWEGFIVGTDGTSLGLSRDGASLGRSREGFREGT